MNARNVVYGSLYMDEGEGWRKAKKQIDYFRDKYPMALFFDVIGWEKNREDGEAMVAIIKDYARKKMPYLDKISVGFTTTNKLAKEDQPRN